MELLAESLKKQDQHSELLTLLVKSDEKQNLILERVVSQITTLNGKVDQLNTDLKTMFSYLQTKHDKLEDRTKRLEDGFFKA